MKVTIELICKVELSFCIYIAYMLVVYSNIVIVSLFQN
jgi:hypothetical protein